MTLEVVVFEERYSSAFLHLDAGHRVVANVVLLECGLVVVPRSKDASVAYDALSFLEKHDTVSFVRRQLDVRNFVSKTAHQRRLVRTDNFSATTVVWAHAVGFFAQGKSHALSYHERSDSVVPGIIFAVPLLSVLERKALALIARSCPENRLSGRSILSVYAKGKSEDLRIH